MVCAMHKSHATQQRLGSLFIDRYELQAPPHYPPFSGPSGALPLTHDPMFSGHSGALPLPHDSMFPGLSGMENTPVMLPRFASHEAATSPISWLSTWQPPLPDSAASAADLEGPLSKSPRPCQVASSKTCTDPCTLPAEFVSAAVHRCRILGNVPLLARPAPRPLTNHPH